jgi:hypothetical protein
MEETIVNRVAGSGLITLNLEDHYPKTEITELDLAPLLIEGTLLREKDLREFVRTHDFAGYQGKWVAIHCSADAVIPTWAFMLLTVALQPYALRVIFGNRLTALEAAFRESLASLDWNQYRDAKVVVKGCSDVHVPESVFVDATARLREVAASIMYGEPCSTVPLFKRGKSPS